MSKEEISLQEYLANNETIRLAITEAVHRYFYDHCFERGEGGRLKKTDEVKFVSDLHSTLSCLFPDWRHRLKKKLERYHDWEPTNAIHIDSKPRNVIEDPVFFCINLINQHPKQ